MSLIDGPFVLAEGRVREGQLEFECPVCQKDMTMGRMWSPGWTMVRSCSRCGASVEVIKAAAEFAPGEALVVQPRRIDPVPDKPAPPPTVGAVAVFLATATVMLAALLNGGRHPAFRTAAIFMGVVSGAVAFTFLRTRARHVEEQRVHRARMYRLGIEEASQRTHDLRTELRWFEAEATGLRNATDRVTRMARLLKECAARAGRSLRWYYAQHHESLLIRASRRHPSQSFPR